MTILLGIVQGLGVVVAAFGLYLLIIALLPGFAAPPQQLERPRRLALDLQPRSAAPRRDVRFEVDGTPVSGWLYLPANQSAPVPCVVMAHGFGGTKSMGLEFYATRFREAGYAALVFDYRHFGDSGGEPRQLLWIPYQLADYRAAVDYARRLEEIDPTRIALWGTSFSGGHVVVTAARDANIKCVVAQCPGLDGRATVLMNWRKVGLGVGVRLIMHGQRDLVRSWLKLSPNKVPIVGRSGTVACMTASEVYDAVGRLAPADFVNEVCARIIIRGDKYRPVTKAGKVRCPVLLQICEHDNLAPVSAVEETSKRLGRLATVERYPIGHFDIYFGRHFERSVGDQLQFLEEHL